MNGRTGVRLEISRQKTWRAAGREHAEAGICKICSRWGQLTSLVRRGVHAGHSIQCQVQDLGNTKSCRVFEHKYDVFQEMFWQD